MLGKMERELFLTKRKSAVFIQSWVRGTRERREYHRLRQATTTIQAFVRGYQQRKEYGEMKLATLRIQQRYRAYTLGREVLEHYQGMKNATVIIQVRPIFSNDLRTPVLVHFGFENPPMVPNSHVVPNNILKF
jgi:abnormal spindle-like microcephaly-associated protein